MTDLIVDATSWFARSWHAARSDEALDGAYGRELPEIPKGTIPIALASLFKLLGPDAPFPKPDRALFCWDVARKNDKKRAPKPEGYYDEMHELRKMTKFITGAAQAWQHNSEADDAVATAAFRSKDAGNDVIIVSGDKDLMQLVRPRISYYSLCHKKMYEPEEIALKFGVKRPSQVAIALAITGDPDDNIKGVHGWGEKRVLKLFEHISERHTFADVVNHIDNQLDDQKRAEFYGSLELTLLSSDLANIPEPAPWAWKDPETLSEYGLGRLMGAFMMASGAGSDEIP